LCARWPITNTYIDANSNCFTYAYTDTDALHGTLCTHAAASSYSRAAPDAVAGRE
jgi:hypothetical protein